MGQAFLPSNARLLCVRINLKETCPLLEPNFLKTAKLISFISFCILSEIDLQDEDCPISRLVIVQIGWAPDFKIILWIILYTFCLGVSQINPSYHLTIMSIRRTAILLYDSALIMLYIKLISEFIGAQVTKISTHYVTREVYQGCASGV